MKTAIECANWAIEAAIYNAVSLGTLTPIEAMAVLLDTVVVNCEDNPVIAQSVQALLQESELQKLIDDIRADEDGDAATEVNGLAWAVQGVYSYFGGDGNLLLLRAAAGIAATDAQVEATLTQMTLQDRIRQSGIFAQERAISQAILTLVDNIEALQSPAFA